jgi:hypothetical protein
VRASLLSFVSLNTILTAFTGEEEKEGFGEKKERGRLSGFRSFPTRRIFSGRIGDRRRLFVIL